MESLQLVHRTRFLREKDGRDYHRNIVSLSAADREVLWEVERIVYFLHRTFAIPVREVRDATKNFALKTAAGGEFTIRADVYIRGQSNPKRLTR